MTREPRTVPVADRAEFERRYASGEIQLGDIVLIGADAFTVEDDELPSPPAGTDCDFCDRTGEALLTIQGHKASRPPARICEQCIDAAAQLIAAARHSREEAMRGRN